MVLKRLVDEGILWMDGDKRGRKVQVKGFEARRDRWYCFWYDELTKRKAAPRCRRRGNPSARALAGHLCRHKQK